MLVIFVVCLCVVVYILSKVNFWIVIISSNLWSTSGKPTVNLKGISDQPLVVDSQQTVIKLSGVAVAIKSSLN